MEILNYINGEWVKPSVKDYFDVINPATGQVIAKTPLGTKADVEFAAKAAGEAYVSWRRVPVNDRVQYLFKLRSLMRENGDEIAKLITNEAGKTFEESKAEMVRAYENIEVACGMPHLSKGEFVEDIAPGIDEIMIRQPVGVCATIAPFNFPGMIPFWYLPYALALNVENQWAEQFTAVFERISVETGKGYSPSWYYGPSFAGGRGFSTSGFASSMGASFTGAVSSSSVAPGSSSGGGGGGSSGGGGGGGGGGGW